MVASDRLSAFDVVMAEPIPDKGRVLTAMSAFWFEQLADVVGNHLISTDARRPARRRPGVPGSAGRIMLCRRAEMLPIECIVRATWPARRGRSTGRRAPCTAWRRRPGSSRPTGCPSRCSRRRPRPRSATTTRTSPSTGRVEIVGGDVAEQLRRSASTAVRAGRRAGRAAGIILADTKFELGYVDRRRRLGALVVCDEVLTPDSSRFWPADDWAPGRHPARASTSSPSATTSTPARLGQAPAAPAAAGRGGRGDRRPATRGLRADLRPSFADWPGRR